MREDPLHINLYDPYRMLVIAVSLEGDRRHEVQKGDGEIISNCRQ